MYYESMHLESRAFSVTAVAVSANVAIYLIASKLASANVKLSGIAHSERGKWCKNGVVGTNYKTKKGRNACK